MCSCGQCYAVGISDWKIVDFTARNIVGYWATVNHQQKKSNQRFYTLNYHLSDAMQCMRE